MVLLPISRRLSKVAATLVLLGALALLFQQRRIPTDKLQRQLNILLQAPEQFCAHKSHTSHGRPGYSVKSIVYIFPQYYPFPENDQIWGVNFTEWDNVRKVTHNVHGLETIRPHESVGYYNGLDFHTRQRQGRFLRDSGIHGAVYHHYWFAGKPVMDGVIQAMLDDGEPNTPFMLSWANEPWSPRWDGVDSKNVFIAQHYGSIRDWRAHFDWLLPFFRHSQYIRSEGRVQFMIYKPSHMGELGVHMFAAWRQWAVEEGLGGMDIIETRWGSEKWNDAIPDAVSEFQPHCAGFEHQRHPFTKRIARIYHRGTLVCWDSTPRHATDGLGSPQPACHPKTWQYHVVEMLRKIKSDPNPIGSENFFFINALNEWGEGNAMEPSVQFGDGYGIAMRNALDLSEELHVWPDISTQIELDRSARLELVADERTDVCVVIPTSEKHKDDEIFKLADMLRSLQTQDNNNWRALVFLADGTSEFLGLTSTLEEIVSRTLDPRIKLVGIPEDIRSSNPAADSKYRAIDWVVGQLADLDPKCASARYLLITEGGNTYESTAFSGVFSSGELLQDLVGLKVESPWTVWNYNQTKEGSWQDRCVRLDVPNPKICHSARPIFTTADLSATFINLARFKAEEHKFSAHTSSHLGDQDRAMAEFLVDKRAWGWTEPNGDDCDVVHNPAWTSCRVSGNMWFDSPIFNETGCYSVQEFGRRFGPSWDSFDLDYYRQHAFCIRYLEEAYSSVINRAF